jgi:hypothetical protein
MADVALVALTLVFLALCWGYVRGCERLTSPEGPAREETPR